MYLIPHKSSHVHILYYIQLKIKQGNYQLQSL